MSTLAPSRWPLDVLPEAVRQELLDGAPALALEAGQVLYRWGDSATSFFVVREGQLELRVKARTSDAVEAKPVATGCVVGIEALLADRDHLEEARAAGPAVVIEIGRGRFERARRDPSARAQLAAAREVALRRRAERVLEASSLGRGLPERLFDAIVAECTWTTAERGSVLWAAGDRADGALLVAEGLVRLVRGGSDRDRTVAYLQAGDLVGAEDVVAGTGRALGAIADAPLEAFSVPAAVVHRLAAEAPDFLTRASRATAARQEEIRKAVEQQGSVASLLSEAYRLQIAGAMLVIDPATCVQCGICSWSCGQVHGATRLVRHGDKMLLPEPGAPATVRPLLLPSSCQHCTNPACMQDCPTAAIARSADGEVYVRESLCTGCGNCARDCPWDNIVLAPRKGHPVYDSVAVKCDLCRGYGVSACVHNCPTGAIFRVTPSDEVAVLGLVAPSLGGVAPAKRSAARRSLGARVAVWLVPLLVFALPALVFAIVAPGSRSVGTGAAAATVLLALSAYGLRKRAIAMVMRFWKGVAGRAGGGAGLSGSVDLAAWLPSHVLLGLALVGWIAAHSGASIGGPLTAGLLFATTLAVVTGLAGWVLYRVIPPRLARTEDRARLPEDQDREIEALAASLDRGRERLSPAARPIVDAARRSGGGWGTALSGRSAADEAERVWQALPIESRRILGAAGRRAIDDLGALRALSGARGLRRSLRVWLPVHVASMVATLGLLGLHVFVEVLR